MENALSVLIFSGVFIAIALGILLLARAKKVDKSK
jgi:hypothetical protein